MNITIYNYIAINDVMMTNILIKFGIVFIIIIIVVIMIILIIVNILVGIIFVPFFI
jgi:hypothetical protein